MVGVSFTMVIGMNALKAGSIKKRVDWKREIGARAASRRGFKKRFAAGNSSYAKTLLNDLIFFAGDNVFPFVITALGAGMMGQLCFSAFGTCSHCRSAGFFVGPPLVPF